MSEFREQLQSELRDTAERLLEICSDAGASDAEIYVQRGREREIQVRNGDLEQLVEGRPSGAGIRVWSGDRSASAHLTDFDPQAVERVVRETIALSEYTDEVPAQALPDTASPDGDPAGTLDLFDPGLAEPSAPESIERARRLEAAAMAGDERLSISGGAGYSDGFMGRALATSRGFVGAWSGTWASEHVEVLAEDDGGKKRNGSWYQVARHAEALEPVETIATRAAARATGQLGAAPIETARIPVVFDPYMAAALVRDVFGVLTGGALRRGASFLADSLGEQIASDVLTLIDDPSIPRGLGSRPWDGEGRPGGRTTFIEAGVLKSYAINTFNGRKLNMQPTGHASRGASGAPGEGPSNLLVAPGERTEEELIATVDRGFYCDSMMGFGFNPVTGDFSRGASGYLIENGRLTRPVSEVTVSARMQEILNGIEAIASERPTNRAIASPALKVSILTVAGRAANG